MAANNPTEVSKVKTLLATLRDTPVNTTDGSDSLLAPIFVYLMKVQASPNDKTLHWFCDRADQLTIDAATFLIRLFAYNSVRVDEWKKKFQVCLEGCSKCVKGFGEVKVSSRHTYFGAFSDSVIKNFYESFDAWELSMVIDALSRAGVNVQAPSNSHSLDRVPSTITYRMVSNMHILRDKRVLPLIRSCPPTLGWPTDPPPPGLFPLMVDESAEVRQWAKNQASKCKNVPILKDHFVPAHEIALDAVAGAFTSNINSRESQNGSVNIIPSSLTSSTSSMNLQSFPYASNASDLWPGFCAILRLIPSDLLVSSSHRNIDLRRIITGHLHDVGPHFPEILRCLLFLLKRLGNGLWQGEGPEFPQVVFDAIKDNPSYCSLVQTVDVTTEKPWYLSWFTEYLNSLRELPIFGDVLAKMVDFLCEELQHERFEDARPMAMLAAVRLLANLLRKVSNEAANENTTKLRVAVSSVLDIHAEVFISVAFGRSFMDVKWINARVSARELITSALLQDVQDVSSAIHVCCKQLAGYATAPPICNVRKEMWKRVYGTLQTNDGDGVVAMITVVSQTSHLDTFNKDVYLRIQKKPLDSATDQAIDAINRSLVVMRDGFLDVLSKFANYNLSSFILDILRRPGVVNNVMVLMLSPIDDIQAAAQTLVGQAFDVDVRLDCFRVLIENLPDPSLGGIFDFLENFNRYAPLVPEACSLSRSLVRCFTDIIEVLCSSPDGLLHNDKFLKPVDKQGPAAQLPRLWSLMVQSITVIFKRTPVWSGHLHVDDMVFWMRDALIFGRDMLAQWRVIESAAAASDKSSLRDGLSRVGKKMLNDLQEVIPELARWLRLTDQELLHQSFALVQSLLDCFRECNIPLLPSSLERLNRQIADGRKHPGKMRLDAGRLSKLEDALTAFESDDEVEFVSHVPAPVAKPHVPEYPKPKVSGQPPVKPKPLVPSTSAKPAIGDAALQKLGAVPFPTFRRSAVSQSSSAAPQVKARDIPAKQPSGEEASSSDSSSDEEEESQGGLASLAKYQQSPKIQKPAERRQVKMLDVTNRVVKNPAMERLERRNDARKTALRLKPDISGLHRALLSWNYDHEGPSPPPSGAGPRLIHVPDMFTDHRQYVNVFEPLLLLECWSQLLQSKEEKEDSYECKILSRRFIDDWLDLDITIPEAVQKDWYLGETDVVLLRHLDGKKCILAKTQSYKATPLGIQASLRCHIRANNSDPGLQINTTWRLKKTFSLSTVHREYGALVALPYYDLFEKIMKPQISPMPNLDNSTIKQAMAAYSVNEPQAKAILGSLQAQGFVLIQGPPGTGKTSTICGLVEAFMSRRPRPATAIHVGRGQRPTDKAPPKKALLCAPSNAAVDEVAHRLKEGYRGAERRGAALKVVRVGNDKVMNISVKDISLDYLVEQKINSDATKEPPKGADNEITVIRAEIESVKRAKQQKLEELATTHDNTARTLALEDEIKRLNSRRMTLTQQFDRLKDKQKSDRRTLDATRRKFRVEVLQEADVICSTLSGAGHDVLEQLDFEMVIIDEAAQAIELSSLIPLKFKCQRCIMVGDPQQLPPTVLSQEACKFQYNQSLFVRLQKHRPEAVHLLSIQYRMHPDISQLPSRIFYQGRLLDGPDMDVKTKQPWHSHPKFGTYRFFNVSKGQEQEAGGHSLKNNLESQVAVAMYSRLCKEFPAIDFDFRVGIVTMYRGQVLELKRAFQRRFGSDIISKVHFHTVDGFQGQEKDVIILSCVRAGPGLQSVGFLADVRRMNVAITRARSSLFILGNAPTLERSDENWRSIVNDARSRSFFTDTDVSYFTSPGTDTPRVTLPLKQNKQPKPSSSKEQSIPSNLTTPRDIVVSTNRPNSKQSPTANVIPSAISTGSSKDPIIPKQIGLKRALVQPDEHNHAAQQDHKPRPPPAKRQKKEKGSIFIPKKSNKPLPTGSGLDNPSGSSKGQ
ncbi:hypothetical protein SERLA73DRAFT_109860 [Serpula lacrymans var. lacrymans S7.3]|uniref:Helicase ATP-binding domain-containing protein n=2 Tax=Serpula lacrymans var. lacrymans TaxID=341189 RepID=F8PZS4_SERL3|nr:uncharacterized protein SERLADRAFT_450249 [Serpula lacrymans var. lacrymans S7.9]EGN98396.1 hypothetical protein SERLA73DRAFT_109860 [Serpula lacrymans var. lacrymans S7.3]EGO23948.1 hypothetical protein SERLADRAFT_450249 [Serpula lacrymans var. lacrymans S7.9]